MRRADPRLAKIKIKQLHRLVGTNDQLAEQCVYLLGAVDLEQDALIRPSIERLRSSIGDQASGVAPQVGVLFREICDALGIRFNT
jgi:hypothetical protein